VFVEYDVDSAAYNTRRSRWWTAHGGGSVSLPMTMVDSGHEFSNGVVDASVYQGMVDRALARPPQAALTATQTRIGNQVQFSVQVQNLSGVTLSSSNSATVWGIVYEDIRVANTNRYVRAAVSTGISNLANNATGTFTLQTGDLTGVNWNNLHYIALAEYRPGGSSGAYDMLQAALALGLNLNFRLFLPLVLR